MSVRLRLTLSYAGFLVVAGTLLLATVWVFLLRYVPDHASVGPGPASPTRSDLQDAFVPRAAQALAFLLLVGLVGGWFLAGRMLAPLRRITEATRTVATGSLSHRIRMDGRDDEFHELADAFDAMVARLEAQVAERERFAANASHELRTPLAITRTLLEVAREDPQHDRAELLERLLHVNARAIGMTEALLVLSRADQQSSPTERVDLSLLAEEAVETLLPLAEERGVALSSSGEAAVATGSPALLQQLTTNLVHNAVVHNLPHGGAVWVTVRALGDVVELCVENTGEPLAAPVVATLTEPFQRGTGRTRTEHSGVGLGLAIVESITRAHEGRLLLEPRPGGGLGVTVRLPAAGRVAPRAGGDRSAG